ncbi:putative acetyltransferase [Pseudoxanthomonas sp. GM95]|uniref:GNAT family N-acetyltransferase n=1 Tax=Pseudoxanthomonas sp. GM95 TaxID=1881043 RepID=UPI0008B1F8AE|nr:GNAT family N-acetyltransferase [Pseudoxanthomonas sp. GM95]SEK97557.1 putative acetyltransferase [Pseudoxanthomonas sp. GM95]
MPDPFQIRPIRPEDDAAMAAIIRTVMPEFGAGGAGFAINDPEVDWLSRAYAQPRSAYFVVEVEGRVLGGGGVAPLEGGDATICELRKMYFLPAARGLGAGAAMMRACLDAARGFGFGQCYIETLNGMDAAMRLYEKTGFDRLDAPLGATGHGGCDRWYLLAL